MIRLLVALCLIAPTARTAAAQTRLHGPAPSNLFALRARPSLVAARDTMAGTIPPTHWKTGMVVGGVAGALGLGPLAGGPCSDSDDTDKNCFLPVLGGAAVADPRDRPAQVLR